MTASNLPTEVLLNIVHYVSYPDLASVSTVCKRWHLAALPSLYRWAFLGKQDHIEPLVNLISLRCPFASTYVQSLWIVNDEQREAIAQSGFVRLKQCASLLTQLRELNWRMGYIPDDLGVIKSIQFSCPLLSSVHLTLPDGIDLSSDKGTFQFVTLLAFKGLVHFVLHITGIPSDLESEHFESIKLLLSNCPPLETLELGLYDENYGLEEDEACTLENLAHSMGPELTVPYLRELHLFGSFKIDVSDLLSSCNAQAHSFRNFLARHPRIEDLTLECSFPYDFSDNLNPEYFAQALPSLKRFSGPDFICDQLVRSSLAEQLDYLHIQQSDDYPGNLFALGGGYDVLPLPGLRRLYVTTNVIPHAVNTLTAVLPMANGLEDLTFYAALHMSIMIPTITDTDSQPTKSRHHNSWGYFPIPLTSNPLPCGVKVLSQNKQ